MVDNNSTYSNFKVIRDSGLLPHYSLSLGDHVPEPRSGGKSKKRKVKKYKRTKKVLHKKSLRGGRSCDKGGRRRRKRKSIKKSRH